MQLKKNSGKSLKGKKVNKPYWNKILNRWFNIPKNSKIVYYKNPNECHTFYFEKVNPDHVGLLWGKRDKKKSNNWVRIGKVFFSYIHLSLYSFYKQLSQMFIYLFENPETLLCVYYIFFALLFYAVILRINPLEYLVIFKKGISC